MTIPVVPNNAIHPVPGPLYARIRDELRVQIVSGNYQPHQKLPSESELISRYEVSRITVRQALGELEKEGLLFKVAGKGMFVSKPKPFQDLARLQGFAEAMSQHGYEVYNRLVGLNFLPVAAELTQRLGLAKGLPVTELRRVRHLNREPVSFDISYLGSHLGERLAKEDLASRDMFLILENQYGIPLGFADLAIDAVLADAETAELLQIAKDTPILRVERLTHGRDGAPLVLEYLYCRTDNFQFRLRINR
ncbi:GntR family transcriptional regulator [Candidatus Methylobacter oryzae]|nr:GntR family transcriptional regulator [Candidatus Methylobacter oryzae]